LAQLALKGSTGPSEIIITYSHLSEMDGALIQSLLPSDDKALAPPEAAQRVFGA
jgi:hypothetical protein